MYNIQIKKSALKELKSLQKEIRIEISDEIDNLQFNPRPIGVKKLTVTQELYRIRIGNFRVLYEIYDSIKIVSIERIGHRKDIYKK